MAENCVVLLIGFGGPTSHDEIRPFLRSVLEGVAVPPQRLEAVVKHYEIAGGVSHYNSIAYEQKKALESWFKKKCIQLPVFLSFHHSQPDFQEFFQKIKNQKVDRIIGVILSSFRCQATFEKYQKAIEDAQTKANSKIKIVYADAFYKNSLFSEAQCEKLQELLDTLSPDDQNKTQILFTAHSIPIAMAQQSGYDRQFLETVERVGKNLKLKTVGIAYQSRSGRPGDAWLEPDISTAVRGLSKDKIRNIAVVPIGFLADHVEVIYDLDIEAKKMIEDAGFKYFRCGTLMDHPKFIELMGTLVKGML